MKNSDYTTKCGLGFLAAVVVVAISFSSCNRQTESSRPTDDDTPGANSVRKPVDAATAGSVTGIVKFEGEPRKMRVINMAAVPNCASMHSSPAMTEDVVLGDNGALQNAVVYLKGDFRQYTFETTEPPIRLDQNGCIYNPHVVALMTGQHLQVTNSDRATHNVNAAPKINRKWNESQSSGASPVDEVFARTEIGIPVKCNVHPWMKAYISVFSNPYFQVTDKDGSFKFNNVPPGTYTLTVWHEFYGTKEQIIAIKAKEEQTATLLFTDRDHK